LRYGGARVSNLGVLPSRLSKTSRELNYRFIVRLSRASFLLVHSSPGNGSFKADLRLKAPHPPSWRLSGSFFGGALSRSRQHMHATTTDRHIRPSASSILGNGTLCKAVVVLGSYSSRLALLPQRRREALNVKARALRLQCLPRESERTLGFSVCQ
jgi:hypothetical protein